jgi:hypothetical protein
MTNLVPPNGHVANRQLEEYRLVEQQARFVMTSYMQGLALYLALVGFGLRQIFESQERTRTFLLIAALSCGNGLAIYAAHHFRKMAYHALDRQTELAKALDFLPPYPMLWGYKAGICSFCIVQAGMISIALRIAGWI